MELTEKILELMRSEKSPMSAGRIAEELGEERKVVDKAMNKLKKRRKNHLSETLLLGA